MRIRRLLQFACLLSVLAVFAFLQFKPVSGAAQFDEAQLARQAVALLNAHCVRCHGAEATSGLDLRTRAALLKGGSRGAALPPVQAGHAVQAEQSLFYQFLSGKQQPRMPLGGELTSDEISLLKRWLEAGAPWAELPAVAEKTAVPVGLYKGRPLTDEERNYWAFRPPQRAPLPVVKQSGWVKNPVDAFILAKLEAQNLTPASPADKRTLLRRVTYDLTGLPPTPEEIRAFLADDAPDAYAKVVKRLLAAPRYGERWAQHWLDVVRFGETNGYELDAEREQAWRYRDYVIKALNEDKPYDQFLLEQLAGDELDPANFEFQVATGFLRAGPQHVVAGNQDEALNRQEWLTEAMFSVGNTVLGLTVGCARCHDHKFDPVSQADYYRLQAFLAATDNQDFKQPTAAEQQRYDEAVKAHKAKLQPIKDQIKAIEKPYEAQLAAAKRQQLEPEYAQALAKDAKLRTEAEKKLAKDAARMIEVKWDELLAALEPGDRAKRAALRQQMHALELYAPEPLPAALAVADKVKPTPPMHILLGGDVHRVGAAVPPRFPSVLLPQDAPPLLWIAPPPNAAAKASGSTGRRLALARWLTNPTHPLTARVMMNRLWQHHFGRGIVATPNDFGRNGQPPTHPELLDWLATEFMQRGWRLKEMHALLVLSNTYQQAALTDAAQQQRDPENKFFGRMNRQRLDAEALRDAVLSVAGNLTEELYGPARRVPIEPEVYDTIFTEYETDNLWPVHPDPRQHTRRSLYLLRKRNVRLPLLVAFDAPDLMSSCGARSVSVHALQALSLMNSQFMFDQSKVLAARVWREAAAGTPRIERLFELALGRLPQPRELQMTQAFLRQQTALLTERQRAGAVLENVANLPGNPAAPLAVAWVDLCLATLNLNEFVYVN